LRAEFKALSLDKHLLSAFFSGVRFPPGFRFPADLSSAPPWFIFGLSSWLHSVIPSGLQKYFFFTGALFLF